MVVLHRSWSHAGSGEDDGKWSGCSSFEEVPAKRRNILKGERGREVLYELLVAAVLFRLGANRKNGERSWFLVVFGQCFLLLVAGKRWVWSGLLSLERRENEWGFGSSLLVVFHRKR
uniref:Uncharacterized protein n=1 Tax=Spongospora subterranea TaxID=70186 RepID=A0A0H5R477_9EUKA|eukprot:CRZ02834.1 hypothetical protein [Spongospora subterranea]